MANTLVPTPEELWELAQRLEGWAEDWLAPEMDAYDEEYKHLKNDAVDENWRIAIERYKT
jgi:hypothetical protein